MHKTISKIILCAACILLFATSISAQSVKSILVEMDKRMNKNCLQKVEMIVYDNNVKSDIIFTMKAKDNNQYLLQRYYAPERWKDTVILMIKEDIWIYDGNSDRFMQVPRSMAFGGTDISHGDILRLNISANYDGEIIKEDKNTWTVSLTTASKEMPYHRIEMLINKAGYYPITAKMFSKSNKHIKTVEYSDVRNLNGTIKPTKYTFLSPYEPDKYSIVKVLDEKLIEYPDYIFNIWAIKSGLDENINPGKGR